MHDVDHTEAVAEGGVQPQPLSLPLLPNQAVEGVSQVGAASEIFQQQFLQGPGHAAARNALADIQERHKDITRLETSIQELHQLQP